VIFQRKHNWIMCWLYTGTFGSFIGYSAASRCSEDAVSGGQRVADRLPRPAGRRAVALGTGWIADRFGGGRVTLWVFVTMMMLGVDRRSLLPGVKDQPAPSAGFFAMLHAAVLRHRRRQRLHLPDDPGDHAQGNRSV
jgi:NNP family nitrate/nitrite transporter-like MFS transporter